jgi:7-cyano-7-deazaguanine synthase
MKPAVVLLSGGLDSATVLALAVRESSSVLALSFRYGQRHSIELDCAAQQAVRWGVQHRTIDIPQIAASALTDGDAQASADIPATYVPARNTLFLAFALSIAEPLGADIWIGVNAVDYSGYPDCRPEFVRAFQALADLATRAGIEGRGPQVRAPLQHLAKEAIIRLGLSLGVDYATTNSCYFPIGASACGQCDSCRIRLAAFAAVAAGE